MEQSAPSAVAAAAPSGARQASADLDTAFVARQPIVNRDQQLVGYELLYRGSVRAVSANIGEEGAADTQVLINTLSNIGTEWLLGGKLAFVNASEEMFRSEYLELVHPDKIVLEVQPSMAKQPTAAETIGRWAADGYKFALGTYALLSENRHLLDRAHYLKLDMRQLGMNGMAKALAFARRYPRLKVVAEKVENRKEFWYCYKLGFELFQGFYFAQPETLAAKVINPSYANVIRLLNLVQREPEIAEIERLIKHDPALSYKLLRYINSAGFALSCEITSFRHAVMILGYKKLFRWLTLLLVTKNHQSVPPALARTAVTRGRLVELLSAHFLTGEDRDNAFVVGLFSLLDAMLDMPMEQVLETLSLTEPIVDAIISRQGVYGPFLQLAVACEQADRDEIALLADAVQLSRDKVNRAHLDALRWTEELGL
jgi:EAL and modified HD-GYP domain-containing signal transduction protein